MSLARSSLKPVILPDLYTWEGKKLFLMHLQSNLRTTAMHGDEPFGLCREFDLISEFFGLDEDLVDPE